MIFSPNAKALKQSLRLARKLTLVKPLDINIQESLQMHNALHRPNHKSVVVIGGGQSGTLAINRLNRNGGFEHVQTALLDKRAHLWVHEGLDLFVYDVMEDLDVKKPILGRVQDLTPVLLEEVIHFDPANHYVGTYDGSELTFDYCVIACGLEPDIASVKGLEFALYDKYSAISSTIDYEQALKMRSRLEAIKGKDLLVYCAGDLGNDFTRPVNHALLLRSKFPTANLRFLVNGKSLCGNNDIDQAIIALFKSKKIDIEWDRKLTEINTENSASFENDKGEVETADFDLMFMDPHMKQPKFLLDAGISNKDFSMDSFQHKLMPQLFGFGSYLIPHNSIEGLKEQSHVLNLNMLLQLSHDYGVNEVDSNREVHLRDYQQYRLFPSSSHTLSIETSVHEAFTKVGSPSKMDFYKLAYGRYESFFKNSLAGTDFGRLGKFIPPISSEKSWVHPLQRKLALLN